jgi:transposase InsO family protein
VLRRPFEPRQYAASQYRDILQAAPIIQLMSRKANCWDNAPMESFFGTLKTELVHHREYPDRNTARRELLADIEGYCNRARIRPNLRQPARPT